MEKLELSQLLIIIEKQLGWGPSANWLNRDFEKLNILILEKTKVSLSGSTLRRLWGKVDYQHQPSGTTLDTLAQFAGFEDWRTFGKLHPYDKNNQPVTHQTKVNIFIRQKKTFVYMLPPLIIAIIFIFFILKNNAAVTENGSYYFSFRPVIRDIPNSVIFSYDAQSSPNDSVFIQQSWDNHLRSLVPRYRHRHVSIYYKPGFYQTKLIVGHKVVKEQPLLIPTNGWLALVDQSPVPVYLAQHEFYHKNELEVSIETLDKHHVELSSQPAVVQFYNVGNFNSVPVSDFDFTSELKSNYNEGAAKCQLINITLITDHSPIIIPLSTPGCIAALNLSDGQHDISGTSTDLSGFGTSLSKWVKISCKSKSGRIEYFINDKLIYTSLRLIQKSNILGIAYSFQGAGSVRSVHLASKNRVIYQAF